MRKRQLWIGYAFILPNLLGVLLFFIIPALFSAVLMFTDWKFTSPVFHFIGLDNIQRLFHDELFYVSLKNTLLFLASVPVSVALAFLVAVVLNRSVYWKTLLRAFYFMPYITSGVAVAFVWMLLFQPKQGPINGLLTSLGLSNPPGWLTSPDTVMAAVDIIWIWFMLGYNMIIYLAALQEISPELLEAAKIDGATAPQTVLRIMLPLVSPTTFMLVVTGLIMTIKTFGMIEALTQGGPGSSSLIMSLYVYKTAFRYYEMGYAATISWALFAVILVITAIQWIGQKKWVHY
ncbi:sugar ABC transporter permease [Paenibacillus doosanensis]|uniref:Lactose transport system permease protein LacF n=1 Tax=Paenibacillus konkukensis TaxID=2020716 RepID=A0ABY4RME2_9BACL|nr:MULTISPECIES: sugar ABC transporter permease [Paenibacillus]MCS7462407.1 sugar ABC transporter permease [Paenibacillus doosanensis]UQZ83210.1 Lactose transport system permease protein LacF [Paenibacillus konkukensis]